MTHCIASPTAPTWHAAGGIFTRPYIGIVAERGPEAIIPFSGSRGFGASLVINSNPTIHVGAGASGGDIGGFERVLADHARAIAHEVRRMFELDNERSAAI
jgi:hypothetical protein